MKRILILGPDDEPKQKLTEAMRALGQYDVKQAVTVREACLYVTQQPYDLALVPGALMADARHALQSLQPALTVAAYARSEAELPQLGNAPEPGVVDVRNLEVSLQEVLDAWEARAAPMPGTGEPVAEAEKQALHGGNDQQPSPELEETVVSPAPVNASTGMLFASEGEPLVRAVLQRMAQDEKIAASLLTSGDQVQAYAGRLSNEQISTISRRVRETWHEDSSALLQFLRAPEHPADLLLFTRPASGAQLLTLAASLDCSAGYLRRSADNLAAELAAAAGEVQGARQGQTQIVDAHVFQSESEPVQSLALIFQPRRPIPAALQAAIGKALQEVAAAANCKLIHQFVDAQLVHIVTTCPAGRSSGWLAHLYKSGVEERIEAQFGVQAQLWRRGFYATESERPLTEVELKLFSKQ